VLYSTFSALIGTQSVLFSKTLAVLVRATAGGDNQVRAHACGSCCSTGALAVPLGALAVPLGALAVRQYCTGSLICACACSVE
jgi:hypothetical protein